MKQILFFLVAILAVSQNALATPSYWFGSYVATPNTTAVRYFTPQGPTNAQSAEASAHVVMAGAGNISSIKVLVSVDPTTATSTWTITVRKNLADGSTTCSIAVGSTSCTSTTDTSFVQGDRIAIAVTPTNGPVATQISWQLEIDGTTVGQTFLAGLTDSLSTADRYVAFTGEKAVSTTDFGGSIIIPAAGTISNFCTYLNTTPGVGDQRDFTVVLNGTPSALTIQFDADDVGFECDNATSPIAVTAGNTISVFSDSTNVPSASVASVGLIFTPTITGDFIIPGQSLTNLSNSVASYMPITGNINSTVSDAAVQSITSTAFTIKALYAAFSGNPGAGNSYTIELREDGADASVPFTVVVADAATSGNQSGTFTPAANGKLNTEIIPASTPTALLIRLSYLGNVVAAITSNSILGGGFVQ